MYCIKPHRHYMDLAKTFTLSPLTTFESGQFSFR